ncbi:MAG: HD domain-containing phosphohydrolase [Synechococcaceae cyanobacterium]|nr:HD domain-containing phosphohydrolase [Synechococcaceae cyanobacterium]
MVSPVMAREVQPLGSVCDPPAAAGAQESGQTTATDRYRRSFETCPDAILLVDPLRRQVLDGNPAMRQLCGDGHGPIAGQPLQQLGLVGEAISWMGELLATDPLTLVGSPSRRRLRWRHRNGLWLAGTGSAHVFVADDRPILQLSFSPDQGTEAEDAGSEASLVQATLDGAVASLTALIRARDPYTQAHQERVAALCRAIATRMGLDTDRIAGLDVAALLHDSGKVSIGLELLTKPTALKPEEYQLIKTHVQTSYEVLKPIPFAWPVATIVHQHHERLDGSGYPLGLRGDQILLEAKILAVADTVESMATDRPYRRGKGIELALEQIENHRGSLYGAEAVDACLRLFREENYRLPLTEETKQPS